MQYSELNTYKSLTQLVETTVNRINRTMNCVKIGRIVSFNKQEQTASVEILHFMDENYNLYQKEDSSYPILCGVPVVVLQGGGANITFPIKEGDQCLVLFCDYMMDNWWISGDVSKSDFPRKHDLSDAIAIVGLSALPNVIKDYSDYLHLKYNEKSDIVIGEQIDVNNDNINLNGDTKVSKTLEVEKDVTAKAKVIVTEDVTSETKVSAPTLEATTAANGSFLSVDNKTVTVVNGIVVSIE